MTDQNQEKPEPSVDEIINHAVGLIVTQEVPKIVLPAKIDGREEPVYVICTHFESKDNEEEMFVMPLAILMDDKFREQLVLPDDISEGGVITYNG